MIQRMRTFLKDESGATAIEYGLIAAGIAVLLLPRSRLSVTTLRPCLRLISRARSKPRDGLMVG